MDFLAGLNPQQREAVAHTEGPLLLLAGAGSGKTRVITHRIAHLIRAHHVPGPAVLAVTFTNKAADEMRGRVGSLLGDPTASQTPLVSTFHSFCVRMLRRDGESLSEIRPGFTRQFTIYDDDDQLSLLRSIYKQIGLDEKFLQYRAMLSQISHGKSHNETPVDWLKTATDPKMTRMAKVYELYEERLLQANALDFDDLLLESVRLLKHDDVLRQLYNQRFEFVMIDEYQDTNRSQYELMRLLTETRRNVCVVGDEDQSIYGWRGADIRNILDFERDYPNAVVIRLEQNYRSTKNILEAAGTVVANNKERKGKWLWTSSGSGAKIGYYEAPDGENEALFIADTIEKLLSKDPNDRVAVLYRTNFQSRQIEEALRRYGRQYSVVGGFSFYQRAEVKDLLAYLKVLMSPQDSVSLLRIINNPARGIGKSTIEQVEQYALEHGMSLWSALPKMLEEKVFPTRAESAIKSFVSLIQGLSESVRTKPVHEVLREILDKTGYGGMLKDDPSPESESRLGNLEELVNAAAEGAERGETAAEFLDHAALVSDADSVNQEAAVSLLTIHNAKGLEFPNVFLAGMEEGLFPHSRSLISETAMEEERRLCYVGMTRAEKRLYLTYARYRRRFGGSQPEVCLPSRFLNEVPLSLRERLSVYKEPYTEEVDLFSEQHDVRESVKRNLYTGKTYNSVENIAQFFSERGMTPPSGLTKRPEPPPSSPKTNGKEGSVPPVKQVSSPPIHPPQKSSRPPGQAKGQAGAKSGMTIQHPKYGRGTVLRREGDGEDAKLTISFPGYGLKKIVEKYAGIKIQE
ncbi:MAG: UvrD-helicase domain-containing protein [Acidobacteriaceae bacterium]|nr:UvrD-helicase domain-containing protein [Acidobacteriaceae bacterium]MBV9675182.1 UvrD-helicase domain-containing protein [Acidobacteriaceae bacterium]